MKAKHARSSARHSRLRRQAQMMWPRTTRSAAPDTELRASRPSRPRRSFQSRLRLMLTTWP
eukprot:10948986-Lingulodinium_polyedra.AAC.1